jgi:hypothetical protein
MALQVWLAWLSNQFSGCKNSQKSGKIVWLSAMHKFSNGWKKTPSILSLNLPKGAFSQEEINQGFSSEFCMSFAQKW